MELTVSKRTIPLLQTNVKTEAKILRINGKDHTPKMLWKEESSGASGAVDDGSRGPSITDMVGTASSSSNSLGVGKDRGGQKEESKKEN